MAQSLCNSNFLVRSGWKDNVRRAIVTDDTRKEQFAGIGPRLVGGKVTIIARQHFRMTPFCRTTIPLIIWDELVKYKDDFSHWVQICFIHSKKNYLRGSLIMSSHIFICFYVISHHFTHFTRFHMYHTPLDTKTR